jgi:acyl-CoA reductase-like NAD-dependent aldehyde dehydrogenase
LDCTNLGYSRGGNDAAIVFPDVDIDEVAAKLCFGAFWNTGQVCTAVKRLYVHERIYAEMLDALAKASQTWKAGPGIEDGVMMGPVQNEMQYNKLKRLFESCRDKIYKAKIGGDIKQDKGFFLDPTIIDNPPHASELVQEEQFVSFRLVCLPC